MLNSKQRAYLRSLAANLDTIFQIGKAGITEEICNQISNALEARELIKMRVLETSPQSVREVADTIASNVGADVVQVIGSRFVLYRESKEHKKIILVKKNG